METIGKDFIIEGFRFIGKFAIRGDASLLINLFSLFVSFHSFVSFDSS